MPRFAGRVAVVTGSARGIGRASASRLAAEGAAVALFDVKTELLEEATAQLSADGYEAAHWVVDVSDAAAVEEAVSGVVDRFGGIDILHSNAGIVMVGSAVSQTLEEWEQTFAVNVRSMFLLSRAVIPIMQRKKEGAIVLTASVSALIGHPDRFAYGPSKGALISMTKHLAVQYARDGIRANCICPGWIDTDFSAHTRTQASPEEIQREVEVVVPMGRQGTADEIAAVVAFLASDDASYVTGQALVIDGGLTSV
jgi:meso-butanediol dehydrogenase/(S,S)-butanediol dehydrogenase/diacetyl reductase